MQWLLKSIGASDELTSKLDQAELVWARPQVLWLGLALLLPLGAVIVWRHRHAMPQAQAWARGLLSACRIGVLLLLVVVLAGPYLRLQEQVTSKPVVALLLDESASMSLPAGPFLEKQVTTLATAAGVAATENTPAKQRAAMEKWSRLQLAESVLATQQAPLFDPLRERFDLRVYRVARQARLVELQDKPESLSAAEAAETNLGASIEQVLRDTASRRLAGIVLLSDGRATSGPDPVDVVRHQATRSVSGSLAQTPIFAVPVGSDAPPVDLAIADVLAPRQVSVGDTLQALVTLDSQGLDGREVTVELLDDRGTVLDSAPLKLDGRERQQVQLAFETKDGGGLLLSARVGELTEEKVHANNRRSFEVRVESQKLKVLYLEGGPRWDFRFLDHALRRDHGIEVTLLMQAALEAQQADEAAVLAAGMPQDDEGFAGYDVVLLGDVSPALLPPRRQEQLARAVRDKGVGLIVQAGPAAMPGLYLQSPLGSLLPVKLGDQAGLASGGLEAPAFAPFTMKVTAGGAMHPAFALYDNATQNRRVWDRMSEFHWVAATGEAGPGVNVLATFASAGLDGGAARPLITEHFAGRGRVLFIGTDSTFRWRRNIGSHLFYRFWGQAIRHVAKRPERSADSSWLAIYPGRSEPEEPVAVELYAVDAAGQPLTDAEVRLQWSGADMVDVLPLQRSAQAGHYRGTWRPKRLGMYRLGYTDARGKSATASLEVVSSDRELRRPAVDRDALAELAASSSGKVLELANIAELNTLLQGETQTLTKVHEQEVWDNWLMLALLVGIYCTDVGLRRMMGLN